MPDEVKAKYYGCGSPFPMGIEGLRVLDLGSGSGRDCYVCAALVGERGIVTGVDMTPAQLEVARRHADAYCTQVGGRATPPLSALRSIAAEPARRRLAGTKCRTARSARRCRSLPCRAGALHTWRSRLNRRLRIWLSVARTAPLRCAVTPGSPGATWTAHLQTLGYAQPNMRFVEGQIERLDAAGIADASVDLIISNCVVRRQEAAVGAPARAPPAFACMLAQKPPSMPAPGCCAHPGCDGTPGRPAQAGEAAACGAARLPQARPRPRGR